jgi:P27 family predicted phage terminase small subunit
MATTRPIPAPDDLPAEAKNAWRACQRQLRAQGTWQDTDAALLESYVRSLVRAREGREAAGDEPYVAGSKGQLVPHPGLRVAAEAERDAERFARALLLTPEARRRHDVKVVEDGDDALADLVG